MKSVSASLGLLALMVGTANAGDALPPGPYQLRGLTLASIGVTFDAAAVDAVLPSNVKAVDAHTGGLNFYIAPEGFALAPYSAGYVWVDVVGQDGSSGPARLFVAAWYSDKAYEWLKPVGVLEGKVTQENAAGVVTATVGQGGTPAITIKLKPNGQACTTETGVSHYIAAPPGTVANSMFVVPYAETFCPADPVSVDIAEPALTAFKPVSLDWAAWETDGAITLGDTAPLANAN